MGRKSELILPSFSAFLTICMPILPLTFFWFQYGGGVEETILVGVRSSLWVATLDSAVGLQIHTFDSEVLRTSLPALVFSMIVMGYVTLHVWKRRPRRIALIVLSILLILFVSNPIMMTINILTHPVGHE